MKHIAIIAGTILCMLSSCSVLETGFRKQKYTDFKHRKHHNDSRQLSNVREDNQSIAFTARNADTVSIVTDSLAHCTLEPELKPINPRLSPTDSVNITYNHPSYEKRKIVTTGLTKESKSELKKVQSFVGLLLLCLIATLIIVFVIRKISQSRGERQGKSNVDKKESYEKLKSSLLRSVLCLAAAVFSILLVLVIDEFAAFLIAAFVIGYIIYGIAALVHRARLRNATDHSMDGQEDNIRRLSRLAVLNSILLFVFGGGLLFFGLLLFLL